MGEVDQFLDEVEAELARLTKENEDLSSKLPRRSAPLRSADRVRQGSSLCPGEASPRPPSLRPVVAAAVVAPGRRARRSGSRPSRRRPTLRPGCWRSRRATPTSWSTRPRTKPTRSSVRPAPRPSASRVEAKTNADRAEADARSARRCSTRRPADRRTQLFGDLERERDKLNGEVETLRSFEREYRSRLKSYFSQQLEALDHGGESIAPTGDAAGAAPKRFGRSWATTRADRVAGLHVLQTVP